MSEIIIKTDISTLDERQRSVLIADAYYEIMSRNDNVMIDEYHRTYNGCEHPFIILQSVNDEKLLLDWLKEHCTNNGNPISAIDDVIPYCFYDDCYVCEHCGEVILFPIFGAPDSWQIPDTGEVICSNCVRKEYLNDYVESLINNPKTLNTILSDRELYKLGFEKIDRPYYSGMYDGRQDSPDKVMEKLIMNNSDCDFIFSKSYINPFEISWCAWSRLKDYEEE